jgi:hypothetical protein
MRRLFLILCLAVIPWSVSAEVYVNGVTVTAGPDAAHGSIYISSTAATTIALADDWDLLLGTTTLVASDQMDMPSNGRLRNTGPSQDFAIDVSTSCEADTAPQVLTVRLYDTGSPIAGSAIKRKISGGADRGALGLHWIVTLGTNDYVEVWVSGSSPSDITCESVMIAEAIP